MALVNRYHRRRVAESAAKPCYVCYKPTSSVLNQADGKDWFYICLGHLSDTGFASPVIDQAAEEAKKKKEELDAEIEKVKKEYEEKQKNKKTKKNEKDKNKNKDKDQKNEQDVDQDEKERDEKIKNLEKDKASSSPSNDGPRIYELNKRIYQMRTERMRNAQQAKQQRERMKDPNYFPSAPTGDL